MTEPATTLVELDYRENLGWRIGMVVITLMAIGTVFVFSAGVEVSKGVSLSRFYQSANLRKALFFPGSRGNAARVAYRLPAIQSR